ncbi:MAG: HAD-IA family hydrolase [Thermoplasmatales archaeon]|nr:HAD-IA family hydrolase [Thermoplasmatales archaeon]
MLKAVFFDFGGTLISVESDESAHYHLMESVKNRYGLNEPVEKLLKNYRGHTHSYPTPVEYRKNFGRENIMNAFMKILKNKKPDYEWFWDEYLKMHRKHVRLYPGAVEVLSWVKKNSFHLGMISDIDSDYLYNQLKALNIKNIFDSITTSEEVGYRKPDKRIFNTALKKAECTGNESIYVGDKIDRDIAGGKNVGMKTIFFSDSHTNSATEGFSVRILRGNSMLRSLTDISRGSPDFITDRLDKIPGIIKRIMR